MVFSGSLAIAVTGMQSNVANTITRATALKRCLFMVTSCGVNGG